MGLEEVVEEAGSGAEVAGEGVVEEGLEGEHAVAGEGGLDDQTLVEGVGEDGAEDARRQVADGDAVGAGRADRAHGLDGRAAWEVVDLAGVREVDDGPVDAAGGDGRDDVGDLLLRALERWPVGPVDPPVDLGAGGVPDRQAVLDGGREDAEGRAAAVRQEVCLLYTSPSPRDS